MRKLAVLGVLILAFTTTSQPQAHMTAAACKKSSGINVFVDLDARTTAFGNESQQVHISPAISLDLISRLESKLNAQGYCVYHNDEFDGAGNPSAGVAQGTTPHIEVALLAHVVSFPKSEEILVYSLRFGDWTTLPSLPYYMLNDKSDIADLSEKLARIITTLGR
jgi:hypothetical protein